MEQVQSTTHRITIRRRSIFFFHMWSFLPIQNRFRIGNSRVSFLFWVAIMGARYVWQIIFGLNLLITNQKIELKPSIIYFSEYIIIIIIIIIITIIIITTIIIIIIITITIIIIIYLYIYKYTYIHVRTRYRALNGREWVGTYSRNECEGEKERERVV